MFGPHGIAEPALSAALHNTRGHAVSFYGRVGASTTSRRSSRCPRMRWSAVSILKSTAIGCAGKDSVVPRARKRGRDIPQKNDEKMESFSTRG